MWHSASSLGSHSLESSPDLYSWRKFLGTSLSPGLALHHRFIKVLGLTPSFSGPSLDVIRNPNGKVKINFAYHMLLVPQSQTTEVDQSLQTEQM